MADRVFRNPAADFKPAADFNVVVTGSESDEAGPFDARELLNRLGRRRMPYVERCPLLRYFDPDWARVTSRGVFLPPQLLSVAEDVLREMAIPTFLPGGPSTAPALVVLLMDASDSIGAEDFMVDVPAF